MSSRTTRLDASILPAAERAEAVRETIASTIVRVEIDFADRGPASARGAISDLGDLTVCSVRSNATTVRRTPRLARDDLAPSIFLGLQMAGSSLVVQHGREAVLRPHDLVLYDSTEPYTLVDADGIRQHFVRIPLAALGLPHATIRQVAATTLSPDHPVADLAATYFHRLATRPDLFDQPEAQAVSHPSVELARALITTHLDAAALRSEALQATLALRIVEYVRAHLGDPDLSAAQIAAEHHVSVRHLYTVLAEVDITLGDWIRTQRLQACCDELASLGSGSRTIAAVARRWGFRDPSSFGRLFRSVYAMSPSEWRALHQPARAQVGVRPVRSPVQPVQDTGREGPPGSGSS